TGTCMVMGTASTMAALAEALGMTLPGMAAVPAPLAGRLRLAEAAGRRIVEMVQDDLRPSKILTRAAFENAVRVLMAVGGSTNAVVHLPAIAGRAGVALDLDDFDRAARTTPLVASLRPSGAYHMEDLAEAGGIPAVLRVLRPLLKLEALTVLGRTLGTVLDLVPEPGSWQDVSAPHDRPLRPGGGLAILRGSPAPDGTLLKMSAAAPMLRQRRGGATARAAGPGGRTGAAAGGVAPPGTSAHARLPPALCRARPPGAPGLRLRLPLRPAVASRAGADPRVRGGRRRGSYTSGRGADPRCARSCR